MYNQQFLRKDSKKIVFLRTDVYLEIFTYSTFVNQIFAI